jgi:C4-dicarboxylate-specific signal transduction histidine kinase
MEKQKKKGLYNVLVVDDDPFVLQNTGKLLEWEGYAVDRAESGEKAQALLNEKTFDLVLTDLVMEKVDGMAVLAFAKRMYPDIIVIMLTGFADMKAAINAIALGADDFMLKPAESEEIYFRVKRCLENRELRIKVDQRKAELEVLNKQLKKDIAQRKRAETKLQKANKDLSDSLTKLKFAQDKLIQSEKLASLGGMASGLVHEINTPIGIGITASTFIKQMISKIDRNLQLGEVESSAVWKFLKKTEEAVSMIHANLGRAAGLLENFKQVSVDQVSEKPRKILVDEYVGEVIASLSVELKHSPHRIVVNCPKNLIFDSRPGALAQIITNFVMNAMTHAFEGMDEGDLVFDIRADDSTLHLICRDNGKGMGRDELKQIFDPFYTTRREHGGTGLGLYVVYNLVTKALSGSIECESTPGKGTAFTVKVPLNGLETGAKLGLQTADTIGNPAGQCC